MRIGSTLSDINKQEEDVPQGSILSKTLFSIKINSRVKEFIPDINGLLHVDGSTINYRSKYILTIEMKLKHDINKINFGEQKAILSFLKQNIPVLSYVNEILQ